MGIISIAILISLVKLLNVEEKPILCAGIYTIYKSILLIINNSFEIPDLLMAIGIVLVLSFLYFWALLKTKDSFWWWIILLGGIFII